MLTTSKVALITNIPAPYRVPVYNIIAQEPNIDFTVIFCSEREPDRSWNYQNICCTHFFLKEKFIKSGDKFIHNNWDVISHLHRINPDVVITTGFNPTFLYAFAYAMTFSKRHIPMNDGTINSEAKLTWKHRLIRKLVYKYSTSVIGASDGTRDLYRSYGITSDRIYKSHLVTDNALYRNHINDIKGYDFIYCGRFELGKCPLFALEVVSKVAALLGRNVTILIVGGGTLEAEMLSYLQQLPNVDYHFHGKATQDELPALYGSAKILLFPTIDDTWGVVANEACACGIPVITTPAAGVAGELVKDGINGIVTELNSDLWADRLANLLQDQTTYELFSSRSLEIVAEYTYENAAKGIVEAIQFVTKS